MPASDDAAQRRQRLERMRFGKASLPGEATGGAARQRAQGVHSRGYLPHVNVEGGTYFVTFRLADSLPACAVERMGVEIDDLVRREHERWLHRNATAVKKHPVGNEVGTDSPEADEDTFDATRARHRAQFAALDRWLDAGHGACWLRQKDVADMVSAALQFFAGQRYELRAWCVMPNHVHAVVRPFPQWSLSQVLHSWKSFTAKEARKLTGNAAPRDFWMPESYNHWCRNEGELWRCSRYTELNPVKAGFCKATPDWPWSSAS